MSDKFEEVTVRSEGFTLSKIVWRRFKAPAPGVIEKTLAANPGLAAKGAFLPVGTVFNLYIPSPEEEEQRVIPVRKLWGVAR